MRKIDFGSLGRKNQSPRTTPLQKAKSCKQVLVDVRMNSKFKEGDIGYVRVPEDMLIHGTIDAWLDGEQVTVLRVDGTEANVKIGSEVVVLPLFCLFRTQDGNVL